VLLNKRVQEFDFTGLVNRFDQARAANATLTQWKMMDSLLATHLSGSDTEAFGGDLAYQYGHAGTLAGIGLGVAQGEIKSAQFGGQTQTLQPDATLKQGAIRLD
jgi:hypothetical protein